MLLFLLRELWDICRCFLKRSLLPEAAAARAWFKFFGTIVCSVDFSGCSRLEDDDDDEVGVGAAVTGWLLLSKMGLDWDKADLSFRLNFALLF